MDLSRKSLGPLSVVVVGTLLEGNTTLRSLNLYRNKLEDIGSLARALAQPSCAITSLDLAHCELGPAAGHALSGCLHTNLNLTALSLYSNYLGEMAAAALWAAAQRHPSLLELNLIGNGISLQKREELREQLAAWLAERGLSPCSSANQPGRGFTLLLDGRDKPQLTADGIARDMASGLAAKAAEQPPPPADRPDLAQGKRAWASGEEGPGLVAAHAVDGRATGPQKTRWASGHADAPVVVHAWWPQWLAIDLGAEHPISQARALRPRPRPPNSSAPSPTTRPPPPSDRCACCGRTLSRPLTRCRGGARARARTSGACSTRSTPRGRARSSRPCRAEQWRDSCASAACAAGRSLGIRSSAWRCTEGPGRQNLAGP